MATVPVRHPETREIALEAFSASGCKTHAEFTGQFGDALGLRTFRGWLAGETPATPMAQLMLREFIAGWRPTKVRGTAS